jgi:uncharacterized protein YqjF (DUF2071 family)
LSKQDGVLVGWQAWRRLLFLHWPIPAADLRPLVPAGLQIDEADGTAWVSVVTMQMRNIRPWWWPRAWAFNFLETNLRTYVVRDGVPGVYFMSLDASSALAGLTGRLLFGVPYFYARKSMTDDGARCTYRSKRVLFGAPAEVHAEWRLTGAAAPAAAGSLDHWFLERYYLFVDRGWRRDQVWRGQVWHTPYPAQPVALAALSQTIAQARGIAIAADAPPVHAHFSDGVQVELYDLRRV